MSTCSILEVLPKIYSNKVFCLALFILNIAAIGWAQQPDKKDQYPKRLKRSESFLGIHFDFHAGQNDKLIGQNVTRQMVENIIDKVKPDYIQCDSKGHSGYSSYPTKVGTQAGGFVSDPLKVWRQVTAERGVAMYLHHSGVFDQAALKKNPSWGRTDKNGAIDKSYTSVFGPYVDELLIPQLKELRDDYGIDGVWVDGECWAVQPDYSARSIEAFKKATGLSQIPYKPTDAHYFEFLESCREGFRQYLNHYVTELHNYDPEFQICSNWAYSSLMPDAVEVDVDFLSGDYTSHDSVNSARLEGRCLREQGKAWDLTAWGFYNKIGESRSNTKTSSQLNQELAIVLALGGGVQVYFPQNRDASIKDWQMDVMGEVAEFCRARQKFCHKAKPVPQIALLFSRESLYRNNTRIFGPWGDLVLPVKGVLQGLLDSQYSVQILMEHHLAGRMDDYPLIVIPESNYMSDDFRKELLAYVAEGGNLLLIGPETGTLFEEQLGLTFKGKATKRQQWLEHNGRLASMKALYQSAKLSAKAKPFGKLFPAQDFRSSPSPAGAIAEYGKGKIAATFFSFGERYRNARTVIAREFLDSLVGELFPDPIVKVKGSHNIDVVVNRINGKLAVSLVNTSGPHSNNKIHVFDDIPNSGPLEITIRSAQKPSKITLEPSGINLNYSYNNGEVKLTVPGLEIHEIIIVD